MGYTVDGVEEAWVKLKAKAASTSNYYLLIVGIRDNNNNIKWKIDLKLPTVNEFQCFNDEAKNEVLTSLYGRINYKDFSIFEKKRTIT